MMKYRVINADGEVLVETEDKAEVVACVYDNVAAYGVLFLGEDGEWHVDETDW